MTLNITDGGEARKYPYAAGYVAFGDGFNWIMGSDFFFWDNTVGMLGLYTQTPSEVLQLARGNAMTDGTTDGTFAWNNRADAPGDHVIMRPPGNGIGADDTIIMLAPPQWALIRIEGTYYKIPCYDEK